METVNHPDHQRLQRYSQYVEAPEFDDVREHLASCSECRTQVDAMSALQQHYPWLPQAGCDEQQHQLLVDYAEQRLAPEQITRAEQLLNDNPQALKAALHYASHAAAMQQAVSAPEDTASVDAGVSWLQSLRNYLTGLIGLRAPLWITVPVTAVVVTVLAVTMQASLPSLDDAMAVVSYQDNPVIQYRGKQQLPGIGFFNKADSAVVAYDDVQVSLSKAGIVTLQWPQVDGATIYKMRLQAFRQGDKLSLGEVTTEHNSAQFVLNAASTTGRYEWILSGHTRDEKTFYTSGGFVVSKK